MDDKCDSIDCFRSMYRKFRAMCLDFDETVQQEFEAAGVNVKEFCSEFIRDVFNLNPEEVKEEGAFNLVQNTDSLDINKPVNVEENPFVENDSDVDEDQSGNELVNPLTEPPISPMSSSLNEGLDVETSGGTSDMRHLESVEQNGSGSELHGKFCQASAASIATESLDGSIREEEDAELQDVDIQLKEEENLYKSYFVIDDTEDTFIYDDEGRLQINKKKIVPAGMEASSQKQQADLADIINYLKAGSNQEGRDSSDEDEGSDASCTDEGRQVPCEDDLSLTSDTDGESLGSHEDVGSLVSYASGGSLVQYGDGENLTSDTDEGSLVSYTDEQSVASDTDEESIVSNMDGGCQISYEDEGSDLSESDQNSESDWEFL